MGRDQFNKSIDVITSSQLELGPPEIVDSKAAHTGKCPFAGSYRLRIGYRPRKQNAMAASLSLQELAVFRKTVQKASLETLLSR